MINDLHDSSRTIKKRFRLALISVALFLLAAFSFGACRSAKDSNSGTDASGIIIISAPAAGEVRRVLVREGVAVSEGEPILEIAVRTESTQTPAANTEDPQARAARNVQASQAEIEAARAGVVRADVEVQRLTPLVASGQATQPQLDAARAEYDRAQQRLQRAQAAAQGAQTGLITARQQSQTAAKTPVQPQEQIVLARASSAGKVTVISARVGQRVAAGQPLATLRAN